MSSATPSLKPMELKSIHANKDRTTITYAKHVSWAIR